MATATGSASAERTGRTVSLTCIRCPLGCDLTVEVADSGVEGCERNTGADGNGTNRSAGSSASAPTVRVTGNQCARGARYGADEATHPLRTVTACICVSGALEPLSAKTAGSVPRDRVREVASAIAALKPQLPINCGDVLCSSIAGTGVAVVATKDLR